MRLIPAGLSVACDIKLKGALSVSMLRQLKDPTLENREYLAVDSQPYHLIITSASGSWSFKLA